MVYRLAGRIAAGLQHLLLPPRCIGCGGPATGLCKIDLPKLDLCPACYGQLPINRHACQHCGLPLSGTAFSLICGGCLRRPPKYQSSLCAYGYAYPIAQLIHRFKYGGSLAHARVLGTLLASYVRDRHTGNWPECVIPVPLHSVRYRARGFNQVIELGRFVTRELAIPMRTDLVERTRYTPEQAGLSRRERRKNLRRVFRTTTKSLPVHVALLDDVITTGSTVNELTRTLRGCGVAHIEVWGLARATTT